MISETGMNEIARLLKHGGNDFHENADDFVRTLLGDCEQMRDAIGSMGDVSSFDFEKWVDPDEETPPAMMRFKRTYDELSEVSGQ